MAAEDYSGNPNLFGPGAAPGPEFLSYYTNALQDARISYDVYDVDARSRTAPDPLGVLSHYKAVIWYTANDLYVREPTQPGGTGNSSSCDDEVIASATTSTTAARLLVTGQQALQGAWPAPLQPARGSRRTRAASPTIRGPGQRDDPVGQKTNCVIVSDDFLQYYLGAWIDASIAATDDAVSTLPFKGFGGPFGRRVHAQRRRTRRTTRSTRRRSSRRRASCRATSSRSSTRRARSASTARRPTIRRGHEVRLRRVQRRGLAAAAPHDRPDRRHHRGLKFQISYDTEQDYDYVFVEAHTVGQDDWTTLPDKNGHTTNVVGGSCDIDWDTVHPFLSTTRPTRRRPRLHQRRRPSAPPARGTPPPATPAASRTGRSTCAPTRASRSRSRSPTRRTSRCSGLGVFLDALQVLKDGAVRASRSRAASAAGRPARTRPGPENDAARGSAVRRSASPTARASPRRTRCCGASASRGFRARQPATPSWPTR